MAQIKEKVKLKKILHYYDGLVRHLSERELYLQIDRVLNGLFFILLIFMNFLSMYGLAYYFGWSDRWQYISASLSLFVLSFGLLIALKQSHINLRQIDKKVHEKLYE